MASIDKHHNSIFQSVTQLSPTKKVRQPLVAIRFAKIGNVRLGYLDVAIAKNSQNLHAILCYRFGTEVI